MTYEPAKDKKREDGMNIEDCKKILIEEMKSLHQKDSETAHREADILLLEALELTEFKILVKEYKELYKTVGFWFA